MVIQRPTARVWLMLRGTVPLMLTLCLVLLTVVPFRVPDLAVVMPSLAMMAVFYWSIYRPDLFPAAGAFLVGLTQDALGGGPLGLMALILVLVHGVVISQRRVFVGKSFFVAWWGFAIIASGAFAASWLLASICSGALMPAGPLLSQALLTIILYPCFGRLFGRVHQRALAEV
jgi:rod shape-determining protein MreD